MRGDVKSLTGKSDLSWPNYGQIKPVILRRQTIRQTANPKYTITQFVISLLYSGLWFIVHEF